MQELCILCLKGCLVSPKREDGFGGFFLANKSVPASRKKGINQAACLRMMRLEAFLYLAAHHFELGRDQIKNFITFSG
jgi:hypothetical protein